MHSYRIRFQTGIFPPGATRTMREPNPRLARRGGARRSCCRKSPAWRQKAAAAARSPEPSASPSHRVVFVGIGRASCSTSTPFWTTTCWTSSSARRSCSASRNTRKWWESRPNSFRSYWSTSFAGRMNFDTFSRRGVPPLARTSGLQWAKQASPLAEEDGRRGHARAIHQL